MPINHISAEITSTPANPNYNLQMFSEFPKYVVDYKFNGHASNDIIEVGVNVNFIPMGGGEHQDQSVNFTCIPRDISITAKTDALVGYTMYPSNNPIWNIATTNYQYLYRDCVIGLAPPSAPTSIFGYSQIDGSIYDPVKLIKSTLNYESPPLPSGASVYVRPFEIRKTFTISPTTPLMPSGQYSVTLTFKHVMTNIVLHSMGYQFNFAANLTGNSFGQGSAPTIFEHQWCQAVRNPFTGEYDRLLISHDAPTVFTVPNAEMTRKIYLKGLASNTGQVIDDSKEIKFTPKTDLTI